MAQKALVTSDSLLVTRCGLSQSRVSTIERAVVTASSLQFPKHTAPSHSRSALFKFPLHCYWMARSMDGYRAGGSAPTRAKVG